MRGWPGEDRTMSILSILAEAAAEHGEEHGPTLLGLGAEGWVYVGVTIFFLIAIFYAKAHRTVLNALDAQIAETCRTLDEAAAIRTEAEALLADAKRQQAASAKDAAALMDHAGHEAEAIVAKAKTDTASLVARREKMAKDKIGAAERAAIEMLQARAASAAAGAAAGLIGRYRPGRRGDLRNLT
jgi:F-type H+-transporting ATPase subunit b